MNQVRVGAGVIIINNDNQVLLGHRSSHKEDTGGIIGRDTWSLPGGKQEFNETITECMIREVKEECNLDIKDVKILSVFDDFGPDRHFLTVSGFTSNYSGKVKVMEIDKEDEWRWFDFDKLPDNLYGPSKQCLKYYISNVLNK